MPNISILDRTARIDLLYITPFDLPAHGSDRVEPANLIRVLEPLLSASYSLSDDTFKEYLAGQGAVCEAMRDIYRERIRPVFRRQRATAIAQFCTFRATAIRIPGPGFSAPAVETSEVRITPVLTMHGVGAGLIILVVETGESLSKDQLFRARGSDNVYVQIEHPYVGDGLLNGWTALDDVAHLLIWLVGNSYLENSIDTRPLRAARYQASSIKEAALSLMPGGVEGTPTTFAFESYFAASLVTTMTSSDLQDCVRIDAAYIRGILTGDQNWSRKSPAVVGRLVPSMDVSTRDSISWFMHLNGALKIYSSEFETDYLTSIALMLFELDILLTQRLVLLKGSYFLTTASLAANSRNLASIRESQMRLLSEFYSPTAAFKDTTASRVQRLKPVFRLDSLEIEAEKLLSGISDTVRAEQEGDILRKQTILTIVFSAFAGGSLATDLTVAIGNGSTLPHWVVPVAAGGGFLVSALTAASLGSSLIRKVL